MKERSVIFAFGIVYSTPASRLRIIPKLVKQIIESIDKTRFDRAHFLSFGDFSLNFEVVYYVLTPDYTDYVNKQEIINLNMYEIFEKENIQFAFPTQTVHLTNNNDNKSGISTEGVKQFTN